MTNPRDAMKAFIYFVLIIILTVSQVYPNVCGDNVILESDEVNLNNVRNQDSVGWCYAYTAADLLSFKFKKRISAVSLYKSGQEIAKDIKDPVGNGGDIGDSIRSYIAKNNGLCLEEDLPSSDFKFCLDRYYSDFLNNLLTVVNENRLDAELNANQCFRHDLEAAFPGVNVAFIKSHGNRKELIESLYNQQCKKISLKNVKVQTATLYIERSPASVLLKNIDDQLSKGNLIGIGYDYNKLNGDESSGGHASVLVGRRTNPDSGACEYLVRNSWGKECNLYEGEGLSCHKNCDGNGCRYSGHFWVSSDRLANSLFDVTYLK